jgi:Domain of unknown function (DUF5615)
MAEPLRYFFDEHMRPAIAEQLRARGIDGLTTVAAGRAHLSLKDEDQLRFATAQGRVLVTEDHHFVALSATLRPHAGIVYFPVQLSIGACLEYLELLTLAERLYGLRPRMIRLDAAYWGLRLIAWIHTTLGAVAVVPWNPKRQKNRWCLPPTWTTDELGKRSSIERFFGRVFSLFSHFRLQRPPLCGWSAVAQHVALTYAATVVVGLAAHHAGRPRPHSLAQARTRSHLGGSNRPIRMS